MEPLSLKDLNMFKQKSRESGFSYIDVMIAIVILMVGILAMLSALTANLMRSYESEKRIIAKQMVVSTIESIISAKEIERPGVINGWNSMRNVMAAPPPGEINGIFLTGFSPVREDIGGDGVAGTADDACAGTGACTAPGSPANNSPLIPGFSRQIIITDDPDPERPFDNPVLRRRITVTIQFPVNATIRQETMSTIVADY